MRRLVLGGRFGERSRRRTNELVEAFAERGGEWIETAHAYVNGEGERDVAAALAATGCQMRVITKVGHPTVDGDSTLDPQSLETQLAISSERLERPLDAVLLHRDDPAIDVSELLGPLVAARATGLVGRIGVANWTLGRAIEARQALGEMWALSLQLSVVTPVRPLWEGTRSAAPADLGWCQEVGVELLAWSPLARGWIPDRTSAPVEARTAFESTENHRIVAQCAEIAQRHACTTSVIALATLLRSGSQIRPIVGAEQISDLDDAGRAVHFTQELGGELDDLVRSLTAAKPGTS